MFDLSVSINLPRKVEIVTEFFRLGGPSTHELTNFLIHRDLSKWGFYVEEVNKSSHYSDSLG